MGTRVTVARWAAALLPVALFGYFYEYALLDVTRAYPLLRGDWSTYVAAENFVRTAPWLSFPIGRLPDYLAPAGTHLAQTDAWPALYPVFRVMGWVMPNRAFQLLGWQLFGGFLATFYVSRAYFRRWAPKGADALQSELFAAAGAVVAVSVPFFVTRMGHMALYQHWVLIWALIVAERVLDARRGDASPVSPAALLAPVAVAAAIQPYMAFLVLPVVCLPLVVTWRSDPRRTAALTAGAFAVFGTVSWVLGFIGTGGQIDNKGFGWFSADVAAAIDPWPNSRMLPELPGGTGEGFGYVGLGVLVLLAARLAIRLRLGRGDARAWQWPLWAAAAAMALYATLPRVELFGAELIDVSVVTDRLSVVTSIARANGRFMWPLLWLLILFAVRGAARLPWRGALALVTIAAIAQVADTRPRVVPTVPDRSGPALALVRAARADGVTRIELQPPLVTSDCIGEGWTDFTEIAPIVLAAATERLQINSGYPSRPNPRFRELICTADVDRFARGEYRADVLYVLPPGAAAPDGLECQPAFAGMTACRFP